MVDVMAPDDQLSRNFAAKATTVMITLISVTSPLCCAPPKSLSKPAGKPPNKVKRRTPKNMVLVPKGEFFMGCNEKIDEECYFNERPGEIVPTEAFSIDRTEVTIEAYAACVRAKACSLPGTHSDSGYCNWGAKDREKHPINCVDWNQASKFCIWKKKRLPTEREWEKAARGTDGRKYPWGNTRVSCEHAVLFRCGQRSTRPVGSLPVGKSPYGALDMIGNVWEWTDSWLDVSERKHRVTRGGSWSSHLGQARVSYRSGTTPDNWTSFVGFRCVSQHPGPTRASSK